jgi:hypothetical protein
MKRLGGAKQKRRDIMQRIKTLVLKRFENKGEK